MKLGSKVNLVSFGLAALIVQFGATSLSTHTNAIPASGATAKKNAFAQLPLPTKVGQVFMLDEFANKVTSNDRGFNYFAGNGGALGSGTSDWVSDSTGAGIGSLRLAYNFGTAPANQRFAGNFFSTFGLTDTLVSLDGSGQEPAAPTKFPGYFLDTQDIYRGFRPFAQRSLEQLRFDARLESAGPITVKVELKDEGEQVVFTQRTLSASSFPGSLFTYQFASCWLDTKNLGADRDPAGVAAPINYFNNTRQAILACQQYATQNPNRRASLSALRWGLSACEGPFDEYFAEAAPPLAHAVAGECGNRMERPLEVGTLTVYGVGSSIVHTPDEAIAALWECQRLGLFHQRFGAADAFNLNIADAAVCVKPGDPNVLRTTGEWRNFTGFGIDHGPMAILIDNYLSGQFVPKLFASYPTIRAALNTLFPNHTLPRFVPTRCPLRRSSPARRLGTP